MQQEHTSPEHRIRKRLGIPDDAEQVLIFSESSHWDPNWLWTSEAYFEKLVRRNLDQAIQALQREPRRVYSIECMFFLRMYWERCPQQQDAVRELVNKGRLRLTSSGVTTADTLLPETEAILRDLLLGQEWLRTHGMEQEPSLAYFADSFGCTPALPSILQAAGFKYAAITRVDGMYFPGCDLEPPGRFPRVGSTAERLLKKERSLDFIWRDRYGAQVLCHWNAFTYGQGDMLAYWGISRVYLARLAIAMRSDRHIARRIHQYVNQLAPYARTPYMLCPIGFDFVEPIPDLTHLLNRYNQTHYPHTGIWVVNAGIDDYLALVECHQDALPVLKLDPNPYWTGFYTARPTLKRRCRRLVEDLLLAEKLAFLPPNQNTAAAIVQELEDAWWTAAVSNHHDFITGTSPDSVVETEQIPWLEQAAETVARVTSQLAPAIPGPSAAPVHAQVPTWRREDGLIHITTTFYDMTLDENAGGAIPELRLRDAPFPFLSGKSNDLVSYRDSGGLWRMGYEFWGGIWRESARASNQKVQLEVQESEEGIEIIGQCEVNGQPFRRMLWIRNDSPVIYCRVEGMAAEGHSVILRFETGIRPESLTMDTPGGIVVRPLKRVYDPTFWPLHHFVHVRDANKGHGLAILHALPGAIACYPDGRIELVAMRNASKEKILGLIGIPGNPAAGHEREIHAFEFAFLCTPEGNWQDNQLHVLVREAASTPWHDAQRRALTRLADSIVVVEPSDAQVVAMKPASRGAGVIVRLYAPTKPESVKIRVPLFQIREASLCDARERDLKSLAIQDGTIRLKMPGPIATIRLLPSEI